MHAIKRALLGWQTMQTTGRFAELQEKKLELEIAELEKPFFKRASFLSILIPILSALVTGLIGYVGNIELQKLKDQKAQLEETTRQLATAQQQFISASISSIEDYLTYLSSLEKYKDRPASLFTESGLKDAKQRMDAFLASQGKAVLLCTSYADKYQQVLGGDTAGKMMARCNDATALIESVRTQVDKRFAEALRELRR